ncbi:MAG: FAD-dependent oxidoreductase [bacterium]|nr:FAD-dependent oxidoreductase [bacterium]
MKYIIIGAGAAGVNAAKTIRNTDAGGDVTLIGMERHLPYNRYRLTDFICGSTQLEDIKTMSPESFAEMNITFRKGQQVTSIIPGKKQIKMAHNEVLPYDKLVIATGGSPRLNTALKTCKKHIRQYYSLEDILLFQRKLEDIHHCIVYGDGLSSLDLIRCLLQLDKKVSYVFKGHQPDWGLLEPSITFDVMNLLKDKGVTVYARDRVIAAEERDGVYIASTLQQRRLTADAVFAWESYSPNISVVEGTEIRKKSGILVNEYLETSIADIYAAGDCVEIYHPGKRDYWINFGWPNAFAQGATAAKNMTGQKESYAVKEALAFNLMGKSIRARFWK